MSRGVDSTHRGNGDQRMKRWMVGAVLVVGLTATPLATPSATAETSSSQHCSTHDDYRNVYDGYTVAHTAKIMGNWGRRSKYVHKYLGKPAQARWYHACSARTKIEIIFWRYKHGIWRVRAGQYRVAPKPFKPHCATESDYNRVSHGMTISQVKHILGHAGTIEDISQSGGYGDQDRSYPTCQQFAEVTVGFSKTPTTGWTEDAKSGVFE